MGSYYDIEQVLADEEKLTVEFVYDAHRVGYLNPDEPDERKSIPKGTKLELPLWLGTQLTKRNFARMHLPKIYGKAMQNNLSANPMVLDLRAKSEFYFDVGVKLAKLVGDDSVKKVLIDAFSMRLRHIFDHARHRQDEDTSQFTRILTEEERRLFHSSHKEQLDFHKWKHRKSRQLEASTVVARNGKRRRVQLHK